MGDQEFSGVENLDKIREREFEKEYDQAEYTPKKKRRKRK
jgi:hypothetical protein